MIWKLNKWAFHWCIDVSYDMTIFGWDNYLNIWNLRVQIIENVVLKFFQIKFLAMYITNNKFRFDILTEWNWQNICMEHDLQLMS